MFTGLDRLAAKAKKSSRQTAIRADRWLCRKLFANDAGTYRLKYGNYLVRANKAGEIKPDGSWNKGYKFIGSVLDANLVDRIVEKYDNLINDPKAFIRRANLNKVFKETGKEYNRILRPVAHHIPEVNEVVRNASVRQEIEAYFGTPFIAVSSEAWRNWHLTNDLERLGVLSNHWHHDSFRSDTVKLYMLLHDTAQKHGPFHFLDSEDSRSAMRATTDARIDKAVPNGVRPEAVKQLVGKKGDLFLINTIHCLHRAGNPDIGQQRDILELRLRSSAEYNDDLTFDRTRT